MQISHKNKQVHLAFRLKKFVDLAKSKFQNEKIKQENSSNANTNELILDKRRNKEFERKERNKRGTILLNLLKNKLLY